ncbi:MAG TPA: TolC family protein [Gemmatimonadaceae bacterium]|nr:TolC family protein [Gemmatimonadaceae bacterium]
MRRLRSILSDGDAPLRARQRWGVAVCAAVVATAASCARYQHYAAAPLDRSTENARYRAHGLGAPAVSRFLAAGGVPLGDSGWSTRQLALASLYYRADVPQARAELRAAQAAEITAGARPAPTADVSAERASRPDEGRSTTWSFSLAAGLTLELGGKRSARLARARAAATGARLGLEREAWDIAQHTRFDALAVVDADRRAADRAAESSQLGMVASLLGARYRAGELSAAEVARADADRQAATVDGARAEVDRVAARAALARDLAVPADSVASVRVIPDARSACTRLDSLSADSLRALALVTNARVGVALAGYAVAESDLRLAVGNQYPDVTIGPGILWEQGIRRWVLSLGTPGIPLQTRGPIAEATARREARAAAFRLAQDSVLAAVDSAAAVCGAVGAERAAADSLVSASTRTLDAASRAFERGEVGETDVAFARLAFVRARSGLHDAEGREAAAGAALEAAVGRWLTGPPVQWPDLAAPPDSSGAER